MANGTINPAKMLGLSNERNRPRVAGPSDIYDQILSSIVDQRLLPGAKLNVLALSEIFKVGRRQIRQVLMRIAYDGLITLHANRGGVCFEPGVSMRAKDVLRARKLVEPLIALHAAEESGPGGFGKDCVSMCAKKEGGAISGARAKPCAPFWRNSTSSWPKWPGAQRCERVHSAAGRAHLSHCRVYTIEPRLDGVLARGARRLRQRRQKPGMARQRLLLCFNHLEHLRGEHRSVAQTSVELRPAGNLCAAELRP